MSLSPNVPNSENPVEDSLPNGSPAVNSSKMSLSPNGPNSENPVENSLPNGSPAVNGSPVTRTEPPNEQENRGGEFLKEMRGWLMIVAILAAGSTYQAGLNPPGGVWQSDDKKHGFVAGTPVLHDKFFNRYQAFFYCNAISFLSSLVIIILLMNKNFYSDRRKINVLEITMVLDLFSFMAAYAAGSCRLVTTSIFIFLLMGLVFTYVISFAYHHSLLQHIPEILSCTASCVPNADQHRRQDDNV